MKTKHIFNYVFVTGLLVLILNDHLLKDLYGNWITGKLSDFAGVLILPMFLAFATKLSVKKSILVTVGLFLFWKSSFSEFFIDAFNSAELISIGRVVDYTDYFAFLILPFTKYVLEHAEKFEFQIKYPVVQKLALNSLVVLSLFVFAATSYDDEFELGIEVLEISACCEVDPINEEVGNGRLYVPSAFTPDFDGLNDLLLPVIDSNMLKIDTFMVFDILTGDTVFTAFDIVDATAVGGYNGEVRGRLVASQFRYQVVATANDGTKGSFEGRVCSLPCDFQMVTDEPANIANCGFSNQFSDESGYDSTIDSQEGLSCYR